ncbi:hypothetical protein MBT84_32845 [Streptomyces sp. MBT84]|nr:hypothetical protein [Streptomyces sp. MBT84]
MPRRNRNVKRPRYDVESADLSRVDETPVLPQLPARPASRRRVMRVRGW